MKDNFFSKLNWYLFQRFRCFENSINVSQLLLNSSLDKVSLMQNPATRSASIFILWSHQVLTRSSIMRISKPDSIVADHDDYHFWEIFISHIDRGWRFHVYIETNWQSSYCRAETLLLRFSQLARNDIFTCEGWISFYKSIYCIACIISS